MTSLTQRPALRVGVDLAPPPPMCFGVPDTPEFKGFEVDLLVALSTHLGRELRGEAALWSRLLTGLDTGALDLVCTAATITPERERQFLFSLPYLTTSLVIICRRGFAIGRLSRDVHRVGARVATPAETYARQSEARKVLTFEYNEEVYRALAIGAVDAVVDDWPIGAWFAAQSPGLAVGGRVAGTEARYGLVLHRENGALKTAIDDGLRALFADGTYAAAYAAWMSPIVGATCDITAARSVARP